MRYCTGVSKDVAAIAKKEAHAMPPTMRVDIILLATTSLVETALRRSRWAYVTTG